MRRAKQAGIEGFALNVGKDAWEMDRLADAYAAASEEGGFALFPSFDMAVIGDSADIVVATVRKYHGHAATYRRGGRMFVSTFAGESITFGEPDVEAGWQRHILQPLAASGHRIFFVPAWTALGAPRVMGMAMLDGAFSWDMWPSQDADAMPDDLVYTRAAHGKVYMAGVSPWFYTHLPYKNFCYKSDWLLLDRLEQLLRLHDQVDMLQLVSWNDYGESHYVGPVRRDMPEEAKRYVLGMEHTAWLDMMAPYIRAYRQGRRSVQIEREAVYFWYRPHPKHADIAHDRIARPRGADKFRDAVMVAAFLHSPADIAVTCRSSNKPVLARASRQHAPAGVTRLTFDFDFQELVRHGECTPVVTVERADGLRRAATGSTPIRLRADVSNFNAAVHKLALG